MANLDEIPFDTISLGFRGAKFRNPGLLSISKLNFSRVLVIGTCLSSLLQRTLPCESDYVLFGGGILPPLPRAITEYDFAVCAITLRVILHDDELWDIPYYDEEKFKFVYRQAKRRLQERVKQLVTADKEHSIPFFYLNFFVPVFNPNGQLQNNFALSNIQRLISELNRELEEICGDMDNSFVVDADSIANTFGKRYFTDEFVNWYSHASLSDHYYDDGQNGSRIEFSPHAVEHFELLAPSILIEAICLEITSKMRIIRGVDCIKMIVVDLDDTLWKGVVGDIQIENSQLKPGSLDHLIEGWPLGIIEALMYCKKRGILLGIISKNDESLIKSVFPAIFSGKLSLDDFAVTRVNFDDKADNMAAILETTNLLDQNVLFIDDNPVERAKMNARFPNMRIIGRYFQYTRHLLLHAPELQVHKITYEATQRTSMVQKQAIRKSVQLSSSPEEFLNDLELRVKIFQIVDLDNDPKTDRSIELINKTNQWNSTGEKVDKNILKESLANGGKLFGFSAVDKFTNYGDIGFVRIMSNEIIQFCMSCRVAGLNIEHYVIKQTMDLLGCDPIAIRCVKTERNSPFFSFISIFRKANDSLYSISSTCLQSISHITEM